MPHAERERLKLIGNGSFSDSPLADSYSASVTPNTDYRVKVVPVKAGTYSVEVVDIQGKELGRTSGRGTAYVRFNSAGSLTVSVRVVPIKVSGDYAVYIAEMGSVSPSGPCRDLTIAGAYNVTIKGKAASKGTAEVTQSGDRVTMQGSLTSKSAGSRSWSADGTRSECDVTLQYTEGSGATAFSGQMNLLLNPGKKSLSGTVKVRGKQVRVEFIPVSIPSPTPGPKNISGNYNANFQRSGPMNGGVRISQTGSSVSLQSTTTVANQQRWKWDGSGTYDGSKLTFTFTDNKGGSGSADLTLQVNGSFAGTYTRTKGSSRVTGRVTLTPVK
jgi:hypothetical protein